ncbi:murein biosynthesis integral membrane protein MurJ [Bifidobacterium simiarum]|uniref:Virulence factor protein n=1 Tax=Bifidobacterium simiarum TaxID=2045441 RepID=A0A2M9HGG8_9BIFI|nr:murein biosynthesis integral membrane protein MurJ [Bifidobacterium simiarum]PJM75924.1 virulence factor protein [Bifidobacterium simiarum]
MSSNNGNSGNSVGRNSMIMAVGTAASRVTGQVRSILLAAAIGTTGIAANAYQTGSMIPQVIFTLVSGGIFNAVLVPQIVKTLKHKDANERLNKLITVAIALLVSITAVMMLATPLVTRLYVNPNWAPEQRALVNSFTLWCMPQIFFYGLYLVLGQILAAKGRFGMYAWSSVFANIVSCTGFVLFIVLFGNAARQPMDFWTNDKVFLTAGTWTLGVAIQALVLFVPLVRLGLRYRVKWGLHGIGLRSMGKVAIWSLALTVLNLLVGMVTSQVNTGAPHAGNDLYGIAGNGSYQYAYSLYILPYSLIAVSITTAVFPKLSRAIADHDLVTAREDLSSSIRSVALTMCFFTAALIAMPVPITRALLPSVSVQEAQLIAGPMIGLSIGLVPVSVFLLIQRTFYAFEDGKSPFLYALLNNGVQMALLLTAIKVFPPRYWAMLVGLTLSIAYYASVPVIFLILRRRFGGNLDGRRIVLLHVKAGVAAVVAGVVGWFVGKPLMMALGVRLGSDFGSGPGPAGRAGDAGGAAAAGASGAGASGAAGAVPAEQMSWVSAVIICVVLTIVIAAVYAALLWAMRVQEFKDLIDTVQRRVLRRTAGSGAGSGSGSDGSASAASGSAGSDGSAGSGSSGSGPTDGDGDTGLGAGDGSGDDGDGSGDDGYGGKSGSNGSPSSASATPSAVPSAVPSRTPTVETAARPTGSPAYRMTTSVNPLQNRFAYEKSSTMLKPGLGDTLIDRYTLVQVLRDEPGLSAWRANDGTMARDCQVFLITNTEIAFTANEVASALALNPNPRFTPIQQIRNEGGACLIVTDLDPGISLARHLAHNTDHPERALSFDAIRTIIGETVEAANSLRASGLNHRAISANTIRITARGITLADAPVSAALVAPQLRAEENPDAEALTIRQLAAVLFEMVTGHIFVPDSGVTPAVIREDAPEEFRILCVRGLGLHGEGEATPVPISTLGEFEALLGSWKQMPELTKDDIDLASHPSSQSIELVDVARHEDANIVSIPQSFISHPSDEGEPSALTNGRNEWNANQLLFPAKQEVDLVSPDEFEQNLMEPLQMGGRTGSAKPTVGLDVSSIRHPNDTNDIRLGDTDASGEPPAFPPIAANVGATTAAAQEPIDSEATVVMAPLPEGYEPPAATETPSYEDIGDVDTDDDGSDHATKGLHGWKRIAIIAAIIIALLAVVFGSASALGMFSPKSEAQKSDPWPSINTSDVAFPSQGSSDSASASASASPSATASQSASASKSATASKSASASASAKDTSSPKVITADKVAKSVPTPAKPKNTTEYETNTQTYLNMPNNLQGRGWYVQLTQPQDVYKMQIAIKGGGGSGQIYAGATQDNPTGGEKVADFNFSDTGVTDVEFTKTVKTQDLVIWVPLDTTPNNGRSLYFNYVKVY